MRGLLDKVTNLIAPKVCAACEGGSGAFYDRESHSVIICPVCAGTGKAVAMRPATVLDLAAARATRAEKDAWRDAA